MTARFTTYAPLASTDTWAARTPASIKRDAEIEAIWHDNMARRDAAAKAYGEPETPHEYYAGRPGSQAEKIVLDCLRALQKLPEIDRLYADQFMDAISVVYLGAPLDARELDAKVHARRSFALLRIAGVAT